MISNVATDPNTGRQVIVANFEAFRKKLEDNIDKACNEFLNEPDWNKNFEIYDALNRTAYLCPFAVAAIRRKLKTKNPEIEILALHLLEGMIKNVPSSHGAVAQPSFMRYVVKVAMDTRKDGMMKSIGKKFKKETTVNKAHLRAQTIDKGLLIIQMLKNAYENSNTYPIFADTYKQLEKQGVRFPALTKDEDATVFAPMYSHKYENYGKNLKKNAPSAMGSVGQSGSVVTNHVNIDRTLPMIRPVKVLSDVYHPDLKTAQENAKFFFEMINASEPGSNLLDNDLIQQLYTSTSEWQQRVVMIISNPGVTDEVSIAHGFQVNDVMNNLMEDYQGLLAGTHRRYEEGLGDIEKLADSNDKDKGNNSTDDTNNSTDDNANNNNNNNNGDAKKDDEETNTEEDLALPPPPSDEGNHSHHARKSSKYQKRQKSRDSVTINKNNGNKHKQQDSADLLDLFDSSIANNNNNNSSNNNTNNIVNSNNNSNDRRVPPHLAAQQSSMGIFDLMAIPSGPASGAVRPSNTTSNGGLGKIGELSVSPTNTQDASTNSSSITNTSATMASAAAPAKSGFDSLGDPFSGGSQASANTGPSAPNTNAKKSDPLSDMSNPFDMFGGGGGAAPSAANNNNNNKKNTSSNVNNNNNGSNGGAANPFGGIADPFSGLSANVNQNGNANGNGNANSKPKGDFMGGGDNPFDMFGGSNGNVNKTNNNNGNNNNSKPKDDFLGGDNPFAGI